MRRIRGETIYRLRPETATDPWGNKYPTGNTERTPIEQVAVAPRTNEDGTGNRYTAVIVGMTVFPPAGTDLEPTDQLEIRGEVYEIEGDPDAGEWVNPYDQRSRGFQVAVRRVAG